MGLCLCLCRFVGWEGEWLYAVELSDQWALGVDGEGVG